MNSYSTPTSGSDFAGTAHVRLAMPAEAISIAKIQLAHYLSNPLTKNLVSETDLPEISNVWHQAITAPPLAHYRVLVAVEPDQTNLGKIVGFASIGPADDPDLAARDGQIIEFLVAENHRRSGHGTRLLQAAIDTLKADGYLTATWWINSQADQLRQWIVETGWAADGAWREIGDETGDTRVKQVRLHTTIS